MPTQLHHKGHGRYPCILDQWFIQCCFTSTETIQTIRDDEARMPTLTFTQLLSSGLSVVHSFSVALRPQRPYRLLGTMSPGHPPPLSHSYEFCGQWIQVLVKLTKYLKTDCLNKQN